VKSELSNGADFAGFTQLLLIDFPISKMMCWNWKPTMQSLFTSLMAALLLFQAATGMCCNRPCIGDCTASVASTAQSTSTACCDHCKHEVPAPQVPDAPCSHHECLGFCTFVSNDKVQVDFPRLVAPLDLSICSCILCDEIGSLSPSFSVANHPQTKCLPVRLHLLNQVILI
jgi:hypothetical protein